MEAGQAEESRARSRAREWGRFTRNLVVQGTAAEWALSWMAGVRQTLRGLRAPDGGASPHLAFFLHDELVVHTPDALVTEVVRAMEDAAAQASRLLFPHLAPPVSSTGAPPLPLVPLDVVVSRSYAEAADPVDPTDSLDVDDSASLGLPVAASDPN